MVVNKAGRVVLVVLCGGMALAQQRTISARAGTINFQQGAVSVDNQRVRFPYGYHPPFQMKNGQVLRIENGRVELLLGAGVYLRMLGPSAIRMQETQLADARVFVEEGSALIEIAGMNNDARLRVICGDGTTELKRNGWYRFEAPSEGMPARLRIYSGDATIEHDGRIMKGTAGQSVTLSARSETAKFDLKESDALQAWASRRSQRRIQSEQRLAEMRAMERAKRRAEIEDR